MSLALQHTFMPADFVARRAGFLRSTIPQPTEQDIAHDAQVATLAAQVRTETRATRRTAREPLRLDAAAHARAVARFLDEACTVDPAERTFKADLYAAWSTWAEEHGIRPSGPGQLTSSLRLAEPSIDPDRPRPAGMGGTYHGVALASRPTRAAA